MSMTSLRIARPPSATRARGASGPDASIRDALERFAPVLTSVPDPMLLASPEGRVVRQNGAARALFHRPAPGAPLPATQAWRENDRKLRCLLEELAGDLAESSRRALRTRRLLLTDTTTLAPVPVEGQAGALIDDGGRCVGLVVLLHDRSEAVRSQRLCEQLQLAGTQLEDRIRLATETLVERNEQLQRQQLVLEQASAARTQFLANVSHELRTPLNAILGYASLVMQGVTGEVPAHLQRPLGKVESNARQLLGVVNDVLDLSRLEAGRLPLHVTAFGLEPLVDEILGEIEPLVERSGLTVSHRLSPVPPLRTDRQKLKQALQNLVVNALKFTKAGSVTLEARAVGERYIEVDVLDTGVGIPPEDQDRIFEAFQQVEGDTSRGCGGTGLGLAIVRRLAEALGGTVRLASTPGQGSRFTLTLPLERRRNG